MTALKKGSLTDTMSPQPSQRFANSDRLVTELKPRGKWTFWYEARRMRTATAHRPGGKIDFLQQIILFTRLVQISKHPPPSKLCTYQIGRAKYQSVEECLFSGNALIQTSYDAQCVYPVGATTPRICLVASKAGKRVWSRQWIT